MNIWVVVYVHRGLISELVPFTDFDEAQAFHDKLLVENGDCCEKHGLTAKELDQQFGDVVQQIGRKHYVPSEDDCLEIWPFELQRRKTLYEKCVLMIRGVHGVNDDSLDDELEWEVKQLEQTFLVAYKGVVVEDEVALAILSLGNEILAPSVSALCDKP